MQALTKEQINNMVANHAGEELLLLKVDNDQFEGAYHAITIAVGYHCPQKDEIYSDLEGFGFTAEDLLNGEVEAGIYLVETYGSGSARNDDVTPLFAGFRTQVEEQNNWVQALIYEARTSWFEATHPKSLGEQGWHKEYLCRYCNNCNKSCSYWDVVTEVILNR